MPLYVPACLHALPEFGSASNTWCKAPVTITGAGNNKTWDAIDAIDAVDAIKVPAAASTGLKAILLGSVEHG